MASKKSLFFCKNCGYESSGWLGKCPVCAEWNSFVEEKIEKTKAAGPSRGSWVQASSEVLKTICLDEISGTGESRLGSGMEEFDRVLGGGFVRGSLILIGGDPGIGKSTLLLQACARIAEKENCLYVSGEESPAQIRLRADRLGLNPAKITLLPDTDFNRISRELSERKPQLAVIDSIQTICVPELSSAPGSVSQVREAAAGLLRLAKQLNCCIVLVGHMTKDGSIAGPRVLEHMVDAVLYFEGESQEDLRVLRCVKNRFGATDEIGLFEMREEGLCSVTDPTTALLRGRPLHVPGSAVSCCMEGTRPLLLEIQALVNPSGYSQPLRMSQGFDRMRLSMLLAVLEKNTGLRLGEQDCYINVAGGLKLQETAGDLPLLAAVLSSLKEKPLPSEWMALGEIGLAGELRGLRQIEKRLQEAIRHGWKTFILPTQTEKAVSRMKLPPQVEIYYISLLNEALDLLFR